MFSLFGVVTILKYPHKVYKESVFIEDMDLNNYVGLKVKIILNNNYYYIGKVTKADESSLDLIDFNGKNVSISKHAILTIQEVKE